MELGFKIENKKKNLGGEKLKNFANKFFGKNAFNRRRTNDQDFSLVAFGSRPLSLSLRLDTSVTDLAHYWASLTVPAHPVCGSALVLGHLRPHSELLFLFHHFLVGGTGFCPSFYK